MNIGFGFGGYVSLLLVLLIKILFVLFIVGLIVGIVITIKNNMFTPEEITTIKKVFTPSKKQVCSIC